MTKTTMSMAKTSKPTSKPKTMAKSSPEAVAKESPGQHSCTKARPRVSSSISPVSSSTVLYNHSCVPPAPSNSSLRITSSWALLVALPWVATSSTLVATPVTTWRPRGSVALIGNRGSPWVARRCRWGWSRARRLVWSRMGQLRGVGLRRKIEVNKDTAVLVVGVVWVGMV